MTVSLNEGFRAWRATWLPWQPPEASPLVKGAASWPLLLIGFGLLETLVLRQSSHGLWLVSLALGRLVGSHSW